MLYFTLLFHIYGGVFAVLLQKGEDYVKPLGQDKLSPLLLHTDGAVLQLDLQIPHVVHILHHILVPVSRLEQVIPVEGYHEVKVRHFRFYVLSQSIH